MAVEPSMDSSIATRLRQNVVRGDDARAVHFCLPQQILAAKVERLGPHKVMGPASGIREDLTLRHAASPFQQLPANVEIV